MGMTIGIDLGTTNSVSCIKKLNVEAILNAEGQELTPSCVTALPKSKDSPAIDFVVGQSAKNLLKQYPDQTVTSVKRLLGREFEDPEIQNMIQNNAVSYTIATEISEPGSIKVTLQEKLYTPEFISGLILRKLIADGETDLNGKIEKVVVTVPAYFSDRQKFATRAACDQAGIKLLRLLPEPTAAAISFGLTELNSDEARTIMVFDLGGGTFDISVLSCAGGSFMEVTKGGDMWLGGDNIDTLLIHHVYESLQKTGQYSSIPLLVNRLNSADKARFLAELKEKAEKAKIALSSQNSASIEMFGVLKDENEQYVDIDITISPAEFDDILKPVVARIAQIATQILHEIRFEPELIDTVLMVGGSSLIPSIQEELKKLFGVEKVIVHPRPMIAVAEGAALMAAKLTNQEHEQTPFFMMHSTAHNYYLQLANGKRHMLVARNTPLPVTVEEKLNFVQIDQILARLRVFNEVDGILETVGELWFHRDVDDLKAGFKEPVHLILRFSVDENNIINMKAWSSKNEQDCIEAQIARGGLAAKLYGDLERTLSFIISNNSSPNIERDTLELSRQIVSTILSSSDPTTGEIRVDRKQLAERQIATLKALYEEGLAPLSVYKFAMYAQKSSASVLTVEENTRLKNLAFELSEALKMCDDLQKFKNLEIELKKFYKDCPISVDLARAENISAQIESSSKKIAQHIRERAQKLTQIYSEKGKDYISFARNELYNYIDENFAVMQRSSQRFDRDVRL